jgi:ATP-dependent DNA helicase RecG
MLDSILTTIQEIASDQVRSLVSGIGGEKPLSANEIMTKLGLSHRTNFRNHYLRPALDEGFIEMTIPAKPNSSLQKYRLTGKGKSCLA